jgi:ATP-dependent Clp protease ATP-binding subunit ClpB
MTLVRKHFRPEFLNRLSDIVVFTPLTRIQLKGIITLQVKRIAERLQDRHVQLVLTDGALDRILAEAYDPQYGARPLKRYLERQITNALSHKLIAGELPDRSVVVLKPDSDNGLALEVERQGEVEPPATKRGKAK